jgi:Protein of unknown function (DUF3124)
MYKPDLVESSEPGRRLLSATRMVQALALAAAAVGLASCGGRDAGDQPVRPSPARPGIAEVEEIDAGRVAAGQTIYVPAYSSVYVTDQARPFDLAITLSIRNTDRSQPIVVTSVKYHDHDGRVAREYVKKPLRIAPLAAMEYFVRESDTSGGSSASFLVEWVAVHAVSAPLVEAVMVGTGGGRGMAFTCAGRVVAERGRPAAGELERR